MPHFSEKRRIGNIAEDVSALFLVKRGFRILARNYLRKWGELDIVSVDPSDTIRFIEVKSKTKSISREMDGKINVSQYVSQKSFTDKSFKIIVSHEKLEDQTLLKNESNEYRPEENIHYFKQKRMLRAIESYLGEYESEVGEREWQIDVMTVVLDFSRETATIKHIENVIFDA